MNTPAHLVFGMTAFGKQGRRDLTAAAFVGALIPDLSLYLLSLTHLLIIGTTPEVLFGELYFSDGWQRIFRVDNSIVLWGLVLAFGLLRRSGVVIALSGAALLHLVADLLLHHDDGRPHFWPLTDWIYESPVSYWDPLHYGGIVGPLEVLAVLACSLILWRRHAGLAMRLGIFVLVMAQIVPSIAFGIMMAG